MRNPAFRSDATLGLTEAQWDQLKTTVLQFCERNAFLPTLPDALLRSLDARLAGDAVWDELKRRLGV